MSRIRSNRKLDLQAFDSSTRVLVWTNKDVDVSLNLLRLLFVLIETNRDETSVTAGGDRNLTEC
jgi:hypothetical protein